jgi:hypothetical protein
MTGKQPTALTYSELYSEPTKNPCDSNAEDLEACTMAAFEVFLSTAPPLAEDELLQNIHTDVCRPIGGTGVFVPDGTSPTGVLRVIHGIQILSGIPGRSQDKMKTFTFKGGVDGVDVMTFAFDTIQLGITADAMVPGSNAWMQHLLNDDPTHDILGPFKATDTNTRTTKCGKLAYIPFELMELVLGADLKMRQTYKLSMPTLLHNGYASICDPLADFLTVALVNPSAPNVPPLTLQPCVGNAGYFPIPAVVSYRQQQLMYCDIPTLMPTSTTGPASDPALFDVCRIW